MSATPNKLDNYIKSDDMLRARQDTLDKNYNASKSTLENTRASATAQAKITNDRLMKYIPQILKSQGLAGNVGVSESALIDANNRLNNRLSTIEANYGSGIAALDSERNAAMLSLYADAEAKQKSEQQEKYNFLLEEMANAKGGTLDDIFARYGVTDDSLSAEQRANLESQWNSNEGARAQAAKEEAVFKKELSEYDALRDPDSDDYFADNSRAVEGLDNTNKGQNFSVEMAGTTYHVQVGTEYTGANSKKLYERASELNISDGEIFFYKDKVYLKADGKLFNVEDQPIGNYFRGGNKYYGYEGMKNYMSRR